MINLNLAKKIAKYLFIIQITLYLIYAILILSGKILVINSVLWGNFFTSSISLIAVISLISFLYSEAGKQGIDPKGNKILTLSLIFMFLGDLLWFLNELFLENLVPIGGWPDISWNISHILLIWSFLHFSESIFSESLRWKAGILTAGILTAIINAIISLREYFNLGIYGISFIIQEIYPIYDFIIIGILLTIIGPLIVNQDKTFKGFYIILFGLLARIVYDNLFADLILNGSYYTGHIIDLIYVIFYIGICLSSICYLKEWKRDD